MRHLLKRILERAVARRRDYRIFVAQTSQPANVDPDVRVFDDARPPPSDLIEWYDQHNGVAGRMLMLARLRKRQALLLILEVGGERSAYGWIQLADALRFEFGWLTEPWLCLGPYWTDERHRGHGAYGRLLAHSLHMCTARFPDHAAYIWAQAANTASIRGIEKAGFRPIGTHRIATYGFGLIRRHEQIAE